MLVTLERARFMNATFMGQGRVWLCRSVSGRDFDVLTVQYTFWTWALPPFKILQLDHRLRRILAN